MDTETPSTSSVSEPTTSENLLSGKGDNGDPTTNPKCDTSQSSDPCTAVPIAPVN